MGPKGLESIHGHRVVLARLERAVAQGRLPHALLFSGPRGVGKGTVAVALGQALGCTETPGRGCGVCHTCDRIRRGVHPDVLVVEAETRQIKIEQVRLLEDRLTQGPNESRALVIVIDEAERLNIAAANALLKSLEEPRLGVHFVLVTAAPHRLPITVRSRCQQFRFSPLGEADLQAVLGELDLAPEAVAEAVRLSDGSVSEALHLAEEDQFPLWQTWTQRLSDPEVLRSVPVPEVVRRFVGEVDDPVAVLSLLLPRLRDALLLSTGLDRQGQRLRLLATQGDEARRARSTSPLRLLRRMESVLAGIRDLEGNTNKHLALEQVVLHLMQ